MSAMELTSRSIRTTLRTGLPARADCLIDTELAFLLVGAQQRDRAGRLGLFKEEIADGVTAALDHAHLSRRTARRRRRVRPPTAEQYLETASRHIHYRSFAHCLLLLSGAEIPRAAMDMVDDALTAGSRAVRLVNDLRTAPKDRAEGSNILRLRSRTGRRTSADAVKHRVEHNIRVHGVLAEAGVAAGMSASVAALLVNSLRVAVGVYQTTDLAMEEAWSLHRNLAGPPGDVVPALRQPGVLGRSYSGRTIPRLARDPLRALTEIGQEADGGVVRLNLGMFRPFLVSDPDDVQFVFRDGAENYVRDGMIWRPLRRLTGNGIASDGPTWRASRQRLQQFFVAKDIDAMIDSMSGAIGDALDELDARVGLDVPFDALSEMTRIVHRALVRVFFGDRIAMADADRLGEAISTAFTSLGARKRRGSLSTAVLLPVSRHPAGGANGRRVCHHHSATPCRRSVRRGRISCPALVVCATIAATPSPTALFGTT